MKLGAKKTKTKVPSYETVFSCEIDDGKGRFIDNIVHRDIDATSKPCRFKDVADLSQCKSDCVAAGQRF